MTEEPAEVLDPLFLKAPLHSARMASAEEVSSDLNRQPAGSKPVSLFFWLQPFRLHGYHNCSCSEDMLLPSGPRPPALEPRSLSQTRLGSAGGCFFSLSPQNMPGSLTQGVFWGVGVEGLLNHLTASSALISQL